MLKTTMSFQVLAANKVHAASKFDSIEGINEFIEKSLKPKNRKLSKSKKA